MLRPYNMIAGIFHDAVRWEYHAKLWWIDHPVVIFAWLIVCLLLLLWGMNR